MRHLLVTNDFPPKHGGIQSYLWELWRRLPPEDVTVLTARYAGAESWDSGQPYRVVRTNQPVLLPTPRLRAQVDRLAAEVGAGLVLLDPALPLGLLGPHLGRPYGLVLHGAEITVPGRTPGFRLALSRVLRGASTIVAAGRYPAEEAERAAARALPVTVVPPGVDTGRFRPLRSAEGVAARERFGLPARGVVVASVSRLVPRKGMDVLIDAAAMLRWRHPDLVVAIGGDGRDRRRLERRIATSGASVRMLGRVPDRDLPLLYGCADLFAMLCRNRWHDLEQEGFGIVFLEAAACGIPQVAGASGGAAEAVADGRTGTVVGDPRSVHAVAAALGRLVEQPDERRSMGRAARQRAERDFAYDLLADRLAASLDDAIGPPRLR